MRIPLRRRTLRARAAVACALVALTACGSTVQQESAFVVDGTQGGDAGGVGTDDGAVEGGSDAGAGAPGSTAATTGAPGSSATATRRSAGGGPTATQPGRRSGNSSSGSKSGVRGGAVHIGFAYYHNSDAAFGSVSATGSVVDFRRAYQAMVDDLNARGGLLGRKVVPHYRPFDVYQDGNVQQNAICTYFTEDQPVVAALGVFSHTEDYYSCLEKLGVAHLAAGGGAVEGDDRLFADYPHAASSGALTLARAVRALVDETVAQGFLTPSSKIGIFGDDNDVIRRVIANHLRPALARHGLSVDDAHVALAKDTQNMQDHGQASTDATLFTQRFKADGVDRVIPLNIPFQFMTAADSNDYLPRYAIATHSSPDWLAANPGLAPARQLEGSVGVGWSPFADVMGADDDQPRPALDACMSKLQAAGIEAKKGDRLWELSAAAVCDNVAVLEAAVKAGGAPITADSLIAGLESLRDGIPMAAVTAVRWAPDRHDGIATVRPIRYVANCGTRACYRYTGAPKPV